MILLFKSSILAGLLCHHVSRAKRHLWIISTWRWKFSTWPLLTLRKRGETSYECQAEVGIRVSTRSLLIPLWLQEGRPSHYCSSHGLHRHSKEMGRWWKSWLLMRMSLVIPVGKGQRCLITTRLGVEMQTRWKGFLLILASKNPGSPQVLLWLNESRTFQHSITCFYLRDSAKSFWFQVKWNTIILSLWEENSYPPEHALVLKMDTM